MSEKLKETCKDYLSFLIGSIATATALALALGFGVRLFALIMEFGT